MIDTSKMKAPLNLYVTSQARASLQNVTKDAGYTKISHLIDAIGRGEYAIISRAEYETLKAEQAIMKQAMNFAAPYIQGMREEE